MQNFNAINYYFNSATSNDYYATMEAYVECYVDSGLYSTSFKHIDIMCSYVLECAEQCTINLTHKMLCAALLQFRNMCVDYMQQ